MPRQIAPSGVVERIWTLYRAEAGVLLPVAAVLFAVQLAIALLLPIGLALVLSLLFLVLSLLYQGFVVELVAQARAGAGGSSTGDLLRAVTPAIGPLLVITLLFAVGVILGFVLIIVPGLVLLTFWCVVVPVEVLERRGVIGSFARSRQLVRGNGWNVFGVIVIVYVAVLAISLLAGIVSAPLGHVGRDIVQWAVNVAVAPVLALSASVLYFELIDAGVG
jgi:ABC-type multidrug transport system fused ATPase/permease subunit